MDRRVALALLVAGIAAVAVPTLSARPAEQQVEMVVTAVSCPQLDVCLAYNGQIPGPTLDVRLGDTLVVELVNRIHETIGDVPGVSAETATRLGNAAVSFHIHGMAIPATMDGIDAHPGTQLARSVAEPGGTFTHRMRAAYVGTWHYHDHVLGLDGSEGVARGLFGSVVVRGGGEARPAAVLDMHLLDSGVNGGRGLPTEVPAGGAFDVVVVGLDNALWDVVFWNDGWTHATRIGPGMSERIHVEAAQGSYQWEASGSGGRFASGEVVAR